MIVGSCINCGTILMGRNLPYPTKIEDCLGLVPRYESYCPKCDKQKITSTENIKEEHMKNKIGKLSVLNFNPAEDTIEKEALRFAINFLKYYIASNHDKFSSEEIKKVRESTLILEKIYMR